ncbi:hypothetical protein R75461_01141 [Paraburkholderia nemoris]|uniref:hypothetical protein n=1 Tax=Paraburkholderia nemoris TaxID=2793076 RepID=UPI001B08DA6D|nr:hypothetical protein [Paraburkholderia nemoris]CAE6712889.1 hypothetical protein R75461_01141 [Paraburkholderia nemoris]
MSDVAAATTQEGAALPSSAPQFDSFFASHSIADEPPPRELGTEASQTAQQTEQEAAGDDASKFAAQEKGQEAEGQQEAPAYASLNELLSAHKIDPESVMGLHVTTKVDGVEKAVPLAEVLKSYQLEGHVNNKSIELSNQRTAFEQEREAVRTLARQQLQHNQGLGNLAMQMLNADFQKVDWNSLRVQNPAEFAALQAEFQNRQGQIQGYMNQLQQQTAFEAQQQQQTLQQNLAQEREKLYNAIPDWRDPAAFEKDRGQISQYARNLGFQDAELNQIFDHRFMRVLHDATRYQALQAANPEVLKRVRQAPPMAAPGSRTDVNPTEAKRRAVVERLNRNPRDEDAQAAAFDFFAK